MVVGGALRSAPTPALPQRGREWFKKDAAASFFFVVVLPRRNHEPCRLTGMAMNRFLMGSGPGEPPPEPVPPLSPQPEPPKGPMPMPKPMVR
jgi:hypothetical protein